jgi:hypothetical protein
MGRGAGNHISLNGKMIDLTDRKNREFRRKDTTLDIQTILEKLKYNEGTFPLEALNEAISARELIIPELLKIIEFTKDNIEQLISDKKYFAHIFALYLLAQFREKRAYPVIVDYFSIPGDLPKEITGDVVTEDLGRILAAVYDGNDSLLKSIIENREIDEYVRCAALESFLVLFVAGEKTREEIMEYFKALFNGKLEREFSHIWNALVTHCYHLYPEEVYDEIKLAYEEELVEPFFIDLQSVEDTIKKDKAKALSILKNDTRYKLIEDTVSELQWWACFKKVETKKKDGSLKSRPTVRSVGKEKNRSVGKEKKIGRNAPCPCGSGKKYKKCCLK